MAVGTCVGRSRARGPGTTSGERREPRSQGRPSRLRWLRLFHRNQAKFLDLPGAVPSLSSCLLESCVAEEPCRGLSLMAVCPSAS